MVQEILASHDLLAILCDEDERAEKDGETMCPDTDFPVIVDKRRVRQHAIKALHNFEREQKDRALSVEEIMTYFKPKHERLKRHAK